MGMLLDAAAGMTVIDGCADSGCDLMVVDRVEAATSSEVPTIVVTSLAEDDHLSRPGIRQIGKPIRRQALVEAAHALLTDDDGAGRADVSSNATGESVSLAAYRILVAEDNAINQEIVCEILNEWGCSVTMVADGAEALARLDAYRFDLVLMDCQMPGMDGYEATRAIRERERKESGRSHQIIVAVTANAMVSDRQKCLDAGMDDFLSKPFRQDQMLAVLRRHLDPDNTVGDAGDVDTAVDSVDDAALDRLRGMQRPGRPSLLRRIVGLYLETSDERIASLRAAAEAGDAAALGFAAHAFKSESANVGAVALAATLQELEFAGKAGQLEGVVALVNQAEKEHARACESLRQLEEIKNEESVPVPV